MRSDSEVLSMATMGSRTLLYYAGGEKRVGFYFAYISCIIFLRSKETEKEKKRIRISHFEMKS